MGVQENPRMAVITWMESKIKDIQSAISKANTQECVVMTLHRAAEQSPSWNSHSRFWYYLESFRNITLIGLWRQDICYFHNLKQQST